MRISEILIIYLAVGAPIGVFAIARSKDLLAKHLVAILAVNIILWPLYVSLEFVPRSSTGNGTKYRVNRYATSEDLFESRSGFAASIEHLGDRNFRRRAINDFERFAALVNAVPSPAIVETIGVPELFVAADHPNPILASKCLFRQNRRTLVEHCDRAFVDLATLTTHLAAQDQTEYRSALEAARTEISESNLPAA